MGVNSLIIQPLLKLPRGYNSLILKKYILIYTLTYAETFHERHLSQNTNKLYCTPQNT